MKAALLILSLTAAVRAAPLLPASDEKQTEALESQLDSANDLTSRQQTVQKEQGKFASAPNLLAQAKLFKAHALELAKIEKELAALQRRDQALLEKSSPAQRSALERALAAIAEREKALTRAHQEHDKLLKAGIIAAKKKLKDAAAKIQKDEDAADKLVAALKTAPAAQQPQAASDLQARLALLKTALDQLGSQSSDLKVAALQGQGENISIGDMFDMQMLMNKLSQLTEMSTAVVNASNTATTNMARNIGH